MCSSLNLVWLNKEQKNGTWGKYVGYIKFHTKFHSGSHMEQDILDAQDKYYENIKMNLRKIGSEYVD
jgi:3-hydroxy-3-methylglutaryl CoA synthase